LLHCVLFDDTIFPFLDKNGPIFLDPPVVHTVYLTMN